MNAPPPGDDLWLTKEFFENRQNFSIDEVAKYRGQHIAWSWDGSRIVDSATDENELWDKLIAAGIDPQRVVFDYVDDI
jgi:hypothetical protein